MRMVLVGILYGSLASSATAVVVEPRDLQKHVERLAADELKGRDTGERGIAKAETYIARAFERAGLEPLPGRGSFFVEVDLYRRGYAPSTALALQLGSSRAAASWRTMPGKAGVDFRPFPFSDDGALNAEVVFAGYGIVAPEVSWDDYAGLDVRGKVVFVLRHYPGEDSDDSPFAGDAGSHASFETKAEVAAEHGAIGMLLVTDPLHHAGADDLRLRGRLSLEPPAERSDPAETAEEPPFLAVQVSRELGDLLAQTGGRSLADLQRAVDGGTSPNELPLGPVKVDLTVSTVGGVERLAARNVVGFLPGRDEKLANEWIVVGGHHDHVGAFEGEGDTIFNGADDNASGTAGVIELARWFSSKQERPRRSMVFATFTAEERGLLGSRALVKQGVLDDEHVVFMLNLDMIGRNPERKVEVFGDGYVRGLREQVESANSDTRLDLTFGDDAYAGNSDHDPFYEADIPFMFFFTGLHEDYHGLGDHADKLDYPRMAKILTVASGVLERLAEAEAAPAFVHHVGWLGLEIETLEGYGPPAATVTAVEPGTRGEAAGFLAGDVIVSFDGVALEEAEGVGRSFRAIEPGRSVQLEVRRAGTLHAISVERAKTGYLGIMPRPVDDDLRTRYALADGEGLVLREVTPDGPAARSGLRAGDIVLQISGRPVTTMNLRTHLTRIGAGETVEMTILRDGERLTLPVTLGERP